MGRRQHLGELAIHVAIDVGPRYLDADVPLAGAAALDLDLELKFRLRLVFRALDALIGDECLRLQKLVRFPVPQFSHDSSRPIQS